VSLLLQDTIAALASPAGASARGIVRISGDDVASIVATVFHADPNDPGWQNAKRPIRVEGRLMLPSLRVPLPASLMWWPNRRSYTGQPMAELHTIGSPPLLDAELEGLFANGARSANRGEFTMRAFLAGRIDLVQAEAVLGVIDAADHEELETALTQLGGGITSQLAGVRSEILSLLGDLEAGLDFVEEDIEFISADQICTRLQRCLATIATLKTDSVSRLPSNHRRRIVLAGLPNAGKSTLFNRLLGSGQAIVSSIAGTTRDYLSGILTIGGTEVELIDTAGREDATDQIMQHAQDLLTEQLDGSDLVIWCTSATLTPQEQPQDKIYRDAVSSTRATVLPLRTQVDRDATGQFEGLVVSAQTGHGLEALLAELQSALATETSSRSELLATTAARCRDSLQRSETAMRSAIEAAEVRAGDEIVAVELRTALREIGTILGEVYTDDILDHIFSNFCIGK